MTTKRQTRIRRSSESIRGLLLDAARDLFLTQGFEATTTKQIAERAGVAEPLLFTNFGSKAELFQVAVVAPIAEVVAGYARTFENTDDEVPAERVDAFVRRLFTMAQRNRTVLLAAVAQRLGQPGPASADSDVLGRIAATLQGLSGVSDLERYEDVDAPAALAAALGMVLGVALLDDLLFGAEARRPGRDRLIAEMEKLLLFGITTRGESNHD